jgi:osmoprotectant transport system ATP-binding protein
MAGLRLKNLSKTFGTGVEAVRGVSLDIADGEFVVFVGPSGCGKTTTLKMINRLIEPTSGTVYVGDVDIRTRPVHELRRGIGYVIQQIGLFPHRTVGANIATVPKLIGWDRKRTDARVRELVDLVGLDPDLLARYPTELSGGQQQRVGVARALAVDPPVLLMDEPYSAVDPIVRAHLQDELLRLQERVRKTIVLVTHDIDEAIKLSDRIALLNIGGILEQYGSPEELLRSPANEFVERFLGAERGLKRMALLKVSDVGLSPGAVVAATASTA